MWCGQESGRTGRGEKRWNRVRRSSMGVLARPSPACPPVSYAAGRWNPAGEREPSKREIGARIARVPDVLRGYLPPDRGEVVPISAASHGWG